MRARYKSRQREFRMSGVAAIVNCGGHNAKRVPYTIASSSAEFMRLCHRFVILVIVFCALLGAAAAQQFPRLQEENLAGQQVVLPDAAAGKVAVLVFGFSRASQNSTGAWMKHLREDFGTNRGRRAVPIASAGRGAATHPRHDHLGDEERRARGRARQLCPSGAQRSRS